MCILQLIFPVVEHTEASVLENRIKLSPKSLDRKIKAIYHDLRSSLFVLKSKFLAVRASLICYGANVLFFFNPEF